MIAGTPEATQPACAKRGHHTGKSIWTPPAITKTWPAWHSATAWTSARRPTPTDPESCLGRRGLRRL